MTKLPRPARLPAAAGCVLLGLLLGLMLDSGAATTQTPVAAPAIDSVTPGDGALTVAWSAPAGVTGITAYDLRYIETSADETVAGNWTEVQDVWTTVDGAWSATSTGTPQIPGPVIDKLIGGDSAVTVEWTAPAVAAATEISAYDLRYIASAASDKADDKWTVEDDVWTAGPLRYVLAGLTNGTGYDVQVRAVADTDGAWSATATGTPAEHGGTRATATTLPLDTQVGGVIEPGTDADFFTFTLAEATGILIYTRGDLDTVGELQDSNGDTLEENDDGRLSHGITNFLVWRTLEAGTYYVKVTSYEEATGPYILQTLTIIDTTGRSDAQLIELDSFRNGIIDPNTEQDYFRFTLTEQTTLIIRGSGSVPLLGRVLRETIGQIYSTETLALPGTRFAVRVTLAAGTYFIRVQANPRRTGVYTLHVETVTEPGSTLATALSVIPYRAAGGTIDPTTDTDYFRIEMTEPTWVRLYAVGVEVDLAGELLDSGGNPVEANLYPRDYREPFADEGPLGFALLDRLETGTYYVKVTRSDAGSGPSTGPYAILMVRDQLYARFIDRCSAVATTLSDPLSGCQWHLDNAGQLGGTAGEDINVAGAWATTQGAGVTVAVVDDGLDYEHADLSENVDTSRNVAYTADGDVFHPNATHGTNVAGIIAARDNGLGVRAVAPRATIYSFNAIPTGLVLGGFPDADFADAAAQHMATTAVSNNSWGYSPRPGLDLAPAIWEMAVERGIREGYGGKGVFYVRSGGNGAQFGDNSNFGGYENHYGVTAVCAVNDRGKRSVYSEAGANLWVCAPSNDFIPGRARITTTTNHNRYAGDFGGTSAAASMVSGVAALVRSANTALTWRDVKLILAASARKNDATNPGWATGAVKYQSDASDPTRYEFNHEYGFGVVDASAAVTLAVG